jgi:pectate lyase
VGTLVGAGSNGHPTPTETFGGGSIDAPTVIENKVITGAVSVNADNVVFRNVHFRNSARTMISVSTGVNGLTIEDSTIECTASPSESGSKQVLVGEDLTNVTVRRTELTGCSRLFILDGNLDGFLWEHNVRHQVGPGFEPNGHSVGLHIAYFEPTYGDMTIRGSYFEQEDTTSYTDQISFGFAGMSSASLVVQNSYFDQDANYTIRCTANTDCTIVNTVFSASVGVATQFESGAASFECNRRPNGSLVSSDALIGGQAVNASCPSLP